MMRFALALALVSLALTAPLAAADSKVPLDRRTHRGASLEEIVKNLAERSAGWATRNKKQSLVIWLVDNTPQMAKLGMHAKLGAAVAAGFAGKGDVKHAVVLIDAKLHLVQKPTDSLEELKAALAGVARKPQDQVRDTMGAIAACATGFPARLGHKAIVLFTVENGDTERYLEQTAALLRRTRSRLFVVSREGIYSDPYWKRRTGEANKHKPLALAGAESPLIEYPWGFLFQQRDPHASVPAGFGIYGLNRLVAESGGAYYLFDPPSEAGSGYCAYAGCRLCSGQHERCGALFDRYLLKQFEPSTLSRLQYAALVGRNPVWRLIRQAWGECYRMGVIYSKPPELSGSISGAPAAGQRSYYEWNLAALAQARARAIKDRAVLAAYIRQLGKLPRPQRPDPFWRRTLGTADALRVQLLVTRFNLGQLIHLGDWAQIVLSGIPQSEFEGPYLSPGLSASSVGVYYNNYLLCHGTSPLRAVRWLGGKQADAELASLAKTADEVLDRYRRTPYELLVRRAGLVRFYIRPPAT